MNIVKKYKKIIDYGIISIIITIVDIVITFVLNQFTAMLIANTIGCICGASIQYVLVINRVFNSKKNLRATIIFVLTFLINLAIANAVVVIGEWMIKEINALLQFGIIKGLSIVIPFFAGYYIRKILYKKMGDKENEEIEDKEDERMEENENEKNICNTTVL